MTDATAGSADEPAARRSGPSARAGVALALVLIAFAFGVPWLSGTPLGASLGLVTGRGNDAVEVVPPPEAGQRKVVLERLGMT